MAEQLPPTESESVMNRQYCRLIGSALAAFFLCCTSAFATTVHPEDPDAARIGSFTAWVAFPLGADLNTGSADGRGQTHVWVWRTLGGRVDYGVDTDSIRFVGDCSSLDTTTTAALFDAIARAVISQGIIEGYSTCSAPQIVGLSRVYHGSCMMRTGLGSSTAFSPCAGEIAYREYQYNCEEILPAITLTRIFNPYECGTSSGCEPAYPFSTMENKID